jgi:hypothetical protein
MEKQFIPGDRVMIKSEGECLKGSVLQVTEEDITVQLEDVSHTVVIEKYKLDTLHLCDDEAK